MRLNKGQGPLSPNYLTPFNSADYSAPTPCTKTNKTKKDLIWNTLPKIPFFSLFLFWNAYNSTYWVECSKSNASYLFLWKLLQFWLSYLQFSIHGLYPLLRVKTSHLPKKVSCLWNLTASSDKVSVQELWGVWSIPLLPLLPDPLC